MMSTSTGRQVGGEQVAGRVEPGRAGADHGDAERLGGAVLAHWRPS